MSVTRIWLIAAMLLLSGCTTFENGVVDKPLPNDPKFLGNWMSVEASDKTAFLSVRAASPRELVGVGYDLQTCGKPDQLAIQRTDIAGRDYLDIRARPGVWSAHEKPPIFFAMYRFDSDSRLLIFAPDLDRFTQAVKLGDLSGKYTPADNPKGWKNAAYADVTASTASLRAYLISHPDAISPQAQVWTRLSGSLPACKK